MYALLDMDPDEDSETGEQPKPAVAPTPTPTPARKVPARKDARATHEAPETIDTQTKSARPLDRITPRTAAGVGRGRGLRPVGRPATVQYPTLRLTEADVKETNPVESSSTGTVSIAKAQPNPTPTTPTPTTTSATTAANRAPYVPLTAAQLAEWDLLERESSQLAPPSLPPQPQPSKNTTDWWDS